MAMTVAEKIISRAGGRDSVRPHEVLWVDVDLAMTHDSSAETGEIHDAVPLPKEVGAILAAVGWRRTSQ